MSTKPPLPALILAMESDGHHVNKGDRGDFTVCKFGLSRYCVDYDALLAFARLMGVRL